MSVGKKPRSAAAFLCVYSVGTVATAQIDYDSIRNEVGTIRIEARVQRFEPIQSVVAGAFPIHTSNYDVVAVWDPAGGRAHESWDMELIYPLPGAMQISFTSNETVGIRRQSGGLAGQSDGPMESSRIGANFKDLWLSNPILLLAHAEQRAVSNGDRDDNGDRGDQPLESHQLALEGTEWLVEFDGASGLPASVRTTENDPHRGRIENRIDFSDWRDVDGIPFPFRLEQFTGDRLVRREIRTTVDFNAEEADSLLAFDASDLPPGDPAMRRWGWDMSHIVLKRAGGGNIGNYPQIDNVTIEEIAPGIFLVPGTHNNLIIEGPEGLALVDASWYPERSHTLLARMAERWPEKPIRYLILTHHHIDHTGGMRPVIEAGASVVTSEKNAGYFREVIESTMAQSVNLIEVGQFLSLDGIGREIHAYDVYTEHADGMIAAYVPDEKLLFNADLFSPNRPLQFSLWFDDLMNAIEWHGIDVEKHVGGHGSGIAAHPVDVSGHTMPVIRRLETGAN
ncbi:MAG: MBL fold metallo-hydrolase [Rhodospirillaceae bacterium]|nr:MBL fold metallo-hydrolase [Rhodospirillaceae bacterium]